jgi:hypothetical protein
MTNRSNLTSAALLAAIWLLPGSVAKGGLIGLYMFNGDVLDSSGNGNNGTVNGTVAYTNNAPFGGEALTLDGSSNNNYVTVPIDSSIGGQPAETFGAWFYMPAGAPAANIEGLISSDTGDFDRTLDIDIRNPGYQWSAFVGGAVVGGGQVSQGTWTFVAVSYNNPSGGAGSYVFDVGGNLLTGSTDFDGSSVAGTTYIGVNPNFDHEFDGEIADAFFCDTALTGSQLNAIETGGPSAIAGACGSTLAGVPEPASFAFVGLGLLGFAAARWGIRRQARRVRA